MKFHIRSVILWSKDPRRNPQIIHFEPGVVNVVTGNARTGKSAIIPIIDYCLCSGSCAIPMKAVRSACEWFGVLIETPDGQKLLARKNPDAADAVEDMYMIEESSVTIPISIPAKNTNASHVKRYLDKLCGLSHLDFSGGHVFDKTDHRIGFRDLMAFVFQPQNVVANRDILFYRTEKLEYKNKLSKNTLPYVLEAVSPAVLLAQHEHERLFRKYKRKLIELNEMRQASEKWEGQINGYLARAEELGLHAKSGVSGSAYHEEALRLLRDIANKTVDDFHADGTTITSAVERQIELESIDDALSSKLAELKARQEELSRLKEGVGEYQTALEVQKGRLAVSDWLTCNAVDDADCPICGGPIGEHKPVLERLVTNLRQVEASADQMERMPIAVDRDVQLNRKSMDEIAEKLRDLRKQKRLLSQTSEAAKQRQFHALSVSRFLGELSASLALLDQVDSDGELSVEIQKIRDEMREYSSMIDTEEIDRRTQASLARISAHIARYMPELDNDHGTHAAQLDIDNLTLRIDGSEGQSRLWNIGSGSNHLSYHIATLLALHRFFLECHSSPVPSLLILDQPSQVYFPEKIHPDTSPSIRPWDNDKDVEAVRKIFKLLDSVLGSVEERLQVIVLDHAPSNVWGQLKNVHLAADWHGGHKLVPSDWPGVGT